MPKIYESPDGGKTVYERDTKTGKRICIEKPKYPAWWLNEHELSEIMEMAQDGNQPIQKILEKLKLIYTMNKEHEENWWND